MTSQSHHQEDHLRWWWKGCPLSIKLLEKIRRWEYVDLSLLLEDQANRMPEEYQVSSNGQFLVLEQDRGQRRRKQISDIFSWMKAFFRYVAALTSYESTTSAQATGLVAHLHLILQLSQELGPQWLKYDTEFRQWAAARNVRQWGDLNFTIYGHCLSAQNRSPAVVKEPFLLTGGKRPASQGACYKI